MPAATEDVPGHLLLRMPDCHVQCAGTEYSGTVALAYMADGAGGRLILRVGDFETPVPLAQLVVRRRTRGIYYIPGTPAPATLTVPNAAAQVVLDAFGVLLARFGVVHEAEDFEDGPVLLGDAHDLIVLSTEAAAKDVVPVQFDPPELRVRELLPNENAVGLLRSAHALSRGIVLATTTLSAGIALASSTFVAHTVPNPAPIVLSAAAQRNIAHAHALSTDAVAASAHIAELVLHVVDQAAAWALRPPDPAAPAPADPLGASADLVLATLAASGAHLMAHGTRAVAIGLGHRYGPHVGDAVRVGGAIARNVGVVHSDARAVGRHALLVRVGQRVAAARLAALFDKDAPPSP